jgi:hypothetical protein
VNAAQVDSAGRAKLNDNAPHGTFFHSMKTEELYGKTFNNNKQLRQA